MADRKNREELEYPQNALQWHRLAANPNTVAGREFLNLICLAQLEEAMIIKSQHHLAMETYQQQERLERALEQTFDDRRQAELDRAKLLKSWADAQLKDTPVDAKDQDRLSELYVSLAVLNDQLTNYSNQQQQVHQQWQQLHQQYAANVLAQLAKNPIQIAGQPAIKQTPAKQAQLAKALIPVPLAHVLKIHAPTTNFGKAIADAPDVVIPNMVRMNHALCQLNFCAALGGDELLTGPALIKALKAAQQAIDFPLASDAIAARVKLMKQDLELVNKIRNVELEMDKNGQEIKSIVSKHVKKDLHAELLNRTTPKSSGG